MTTLRISAKNLGKLTMPDCCPRCFWLSCHMGFKLPHQVFPSIFSSLDSLQKKVLNRYFDLHGIIPPWFSGIAATGSPIKIPHHSIYNFHDPSTDILLTGAPDEMLRLLDGRLYILDYKTARHSEGQDNLLPIYVTQLNGYALIAEKLGLGIVAGLSLVYFEPLTDVTTDDVDELVRDDGFVMPFTASVVSVSLDMSIIPPLLFKARRIYDLTTAPEPREGCRDCGLVKKMGEMVGT